MKLEWVQVNLDLKHTWVKGNESKNRRPIAIPLNDVAIRVLEQQLGKHPERVFTYLGKAVCSYEYQGLEECVKTCRD